MNDLPFTSFEELDHYLRARDFSGVALVAHAGEPVFHEAYGWADQRFRVPNRPDTRFNLASINKMFTIVATLQLAERGLLALDDTLDNFRPDFPPEIGRKVTLRHLLQGRSGWGDYWGHEAYAAGWLSRRSVDDYVAFIKTIPLDFEPGQDQQHSDISFEVLGAVIEAASGQSYYDYVRAHIFQPLGMADTESFERDVPVENLAIGYTHWTPPEGGGGAAYRRFLASAFEMCDQGAPPEARGQRRENTFLLHIKGTPAGGGYSTATDLLKFGLALRQFKLLGPLYTAINFSGFEDVEKPPTKLSGKIRLVFGGSAPGVSAFYGVRFTHDVIVLSNYDPPIADEWGEHIMSMLSSLKEAK
jgi:CubicO group peptidase (beta-lactamase class C family)